MHTSCYDTMIADYPKAERNIYNLPETLPMTFEKVQDMCYGENPHQQAAFCRKFGKKICIKMKIGALPESRAPCVWEEHHAG